MSALTLPAPPPAWPTPPLPPGVAWHQRMTPDEYDRLIDTRLLTTAHKAELLDGVLVPKMSQEHPHEFAVKTLNTRLTWALGSEWEVRCQLPIRLPNGRPESDVMVLHSDPNDYRTRRPTAADVAAVIEVADTSLAIDTGVKRRSYASAGIAMYWVVNLEDRRVEVSTQPAGNAYGRQDNYLAGESVPLVLDGQTALHVAVDDLLL